MVKVVNVRTEKYDVYIGRKIASYPESIFYNPFKLKDYKGKNPRFQCLGDFIHYFNQKVKDSEFKKQVLELKGKTLGCWCKPLPCHGDVITDFIKSQEPYFKPGLHNLLE